MAEPGDLLGRRRRAREEIGRLRTLVRWQLALAGVWATIAVGRLATGSGPGWLQGLTAVAAVCFLGEGLRLTRRLRRERTRLAGLVGVELRPLTETTLSWLVEAALLGADADEVTPPLTPGPAWTEERIAWLRSFHRDRRWGLDGPEHEATWAVVDVGADADREGGTVVGGVRLRRTGDPRVLETGIWLVREARGKGLGRRAVQAVLERARDAGAGSVVAETTPGNVAALGLLRSLGAALAADGHVVRAELRLVEPGLSSP